MTTHTQLRQPTVREITNAYNHILHEIDQLDSHQFSRSLNQRDATFLVEHRQRLMALANFVYSIHHEEIPNHSAED